jgi:hypothetical protein
METEDGVIWVYGTGEDGVMAFTDFGIDNLMGLIKMQKADPSSSSGGIGEPIHVLRNRPMGVHRRSL